MLFFIIDLATLTVRGPSIRKSKLTQSDAGSTTLTAQTEKQEKTIATKQRPQPNSQMEELQKSLSEMQIQLENIKKKPSKSEDDKPGRKNRSVKLSGSGSMNQRTKPNL